MVNQSLLREEDDTIEEVKFCIGYIEGEYIHLISNDLNKQQKDDLELIKRQYKHVVDIITYDDFLLGLKNITYALETKI